MVNWKSTPLNTYTIVVAGHDELSVGFERGSEAGRAVLFSDSKERGRFVFGEFDRGDLKTLTALLDAAFSEARYFKREYEQAISQIDSLESRLRSVDFMGLV